MNHTSRVLLAMGAATLLTYGTALAQAPAQPPQAPPGSTSPASPSSPGAQSQSSARTMTATGELVSVNAKEDELTVKTSTGQMTFKYDDDTKVTGASRNTAGLATMSGSQVTISYTKDGSDNLATSIEVKPSTGASPRSTSPASPGDRPSPGGGDRPGDRPSPGGDDRPSPGAPPTPRP